MTIQTFFSCVHSLHSSLKCTVLCERTSDFRVSCWLIEAPSSGLQCPQVFQMAAFGCIAAGRLNLAISTFIELLPHWPEDSGAASADKQSVFKQAQPIVCSLL